MSNRIVRTFALVAFAALAACAGPDTAGAPSKVAEGLNAPALIVVGAFRDQGWRLTEMDRHDAAAQYVVNFWDESRNLRLSVVVRDRRWREAKYPNINGPELYRQFNEHAVTRIEDFRSAGADGVPPAQYRYDIFDQGAKGWNVAGGRTLEDGKPIIVETVHSAYARHGVWVRATLLASDRPESLRAVMTDVVHTLAALTLDPA